MSKTAYLSLYGQFIPVPTPFRDPGPTARQDGDAENVEVSDV